MFDWLIFDEFLEFFIGAGGDNLTLVEDDDAVAELLDFFHVVGCIDDGGALPAEGFDVVEDVLAALRVDGDGRLIEENEFRTMGDAASDIESAEKAAGKLLRVELAEIFEADEFDCVIDTFFTLGFIFNIETAEKVDIVLNFELFEDGNFLENDADLTLQVVGGGGHGFTEDFDSSLVELEERKETVDGRRLAGAVRAEQAEDFAFFDVEGKVVDGFQGLFGLRIFVSLRQMTNFDDVLCNLSQFGRFSGLYRFRRGGFRGFRGFIGFRHGEFPFLGFCDQ